MTMVEGDIRHIVSAQFRTNHRLIPVWLIVWIMLVQNVHSFWWYVGLASTGYQPTPDSVDRCTEIGVFLPHQQELCSRSKAIVDVVSLGASMGIEECQFQFSDRRWNCTTFNTTDVFGQVLKLKSREKAYIYAISSAGVMHAVTKACAKGDLGTCNCDTKVSVRQPAPDFMWGGCSHNVRYGDKFARRFVDHNEDVRRDDGLMNIWNNKAGRKAVNGNLKLLCKCHGVSGSCSQRICWQTMATFREIGDKLKDRFDGASQVRYLQKRGRPKLRRIDKTHKRPGKDDLVYLENSPDYCSLNLDTGSLGTTGRKCNRTSQGLDGCNLMCCGRGYNIVITDNEEDCNCKFFWCCRVICQKCPVRREEYFCK